MNLNIDFDNMDERSRTIVMQRLKAPFKPNEYDLRPGATTADKSKGKPLVYIDPRTAANRLNKVFGFGGWSSTVKEVITELDMKEMKSNQYKGLLVGCVCTIHVHRGQMNFAVENVGDKSMMDPVDNKITSSWAQAFKRSASLLGVGSFLYAMDLPWIKMPNQYGFGDLSTKDLVQILDGGITEALAADGFEGICEITGEFVNWKVAAETMSVYGAVLSKEGVESLKSGS